MDSNVLLVAVVSPALLALLGYIFRRFEKQAEWDREDELEAAKALAAKEVAEALIKRQGEISEGLTKVAELAASTAAGVDSQLQQIHTLVNSDLTERYKSERVAIAAHVVTLKRSESPTTEETELIADLEERVGELDALLADRARQQAKMEAERNGTGP